MPHEPTSLVRPLTSHPGLPLAATALALLTGGCPPPDTDDDPVDDTAAADTAAMDTGAIADVTLADCEASGTATIAEDGDPAAPFTDLPTSYAIASRSILPEGVAVKLVFAQSDLLPGVEGDDFLQVIFGISAADGVLEGTVVGLQDLQNGAMGELRDGDHLGDGQSTWVADDLAVQWSADTFAPGGVVSGTYTLDLRVACGEALRSFSYTGTFEADVMDEDDPVIRACRGDAFVEPSLAESTEPGLLRSVTVDGTPWVAEEAAVQIAPTESALALSADAADGTSLVITSDALTEGATPVTASYGDDTCSWGAGTGVQMTITSEGADLTEGPIDVSTTATLPLVDGETSCADEVVLTVDAGAAVCEPEP